MSKKDDFGEKLRILKLRALDTLGIVLDDEDVNKRLKAAHEILDFDVKKRGTSTPLVNFNLNLERQRSGMKAVEGITSEVKVVTDQSS